MLMVVKKIYNTMYKYIRFFKESIKCNLKSLLEYKKSFLIQSIFMFFNNAFFLIIWKVMLGASKGNANTFEFDEILYLWSLPVISFGIAFFFFGGIRDLGKYILEGGLDTYLIQPKNLLINVMLSRMDFAAFGDLMYGLIMGLFATKFNLGKYVLLVSFGIIGAIFYICVEAIIRLISVWVGNTDYAEHLLINTLVVNFSSYPEAIYNNAVKFVLYTIIPSAYISFLPIKIVHIFNWKYLLMYMIAVFAFVLVTAGLTKIVMKKYESGNAMVMRG